MAVSVYRHKILFLCLVLASLPLLAMIFYLPHIHVPLIPVGQETLAGQGKSQGLKTFDIFCGFPSPTPLGSLSVVSLLPSAEWFF